MSTKKTTATTPKDQLQARLDERQGVVDARETELAEVRKRNTEHTAKRASGALDYDAPAHLQDEHQEQALVRFLGAQYPHLEVESQAVESHRLAEAVGDLVAQREAVDGKRTEAVEKIRAALAEYTEAVTAQNSELTSLIGDARRAGLIEGEADPTLPVISAGGTHGHPRRLIHQGENFAAISADTDSIIQEARR